MSRKNINSQAIYLLLGLAIPLLFGSCATSTAILYHPNEAYMMAVSDKGDLKLSGTYGARDIRFLDEDQPRKLKRTSLQVAYSPLDRLAVVSSYYNSKSQHQSLPVFEKIQNLELGLGYYHKKGMEKETDKSYFLPDIYVGVGSGNIESQFTTAGVSRVNYLRYFLHGGVHFGWKDNFDIGFGMRYVRANFQSAKLIGKIPQYYDLSVSNVAENSQQNLLETSFQIQGGHRMVKAFLRATTTISKHFYNYDYNAIHTSNVQVGIILELDELWQSFAKK